MIDLKAVRRQAREIVKRHYMLLTVLCAISIFLGTEFNHVVGNAQTWYDILRGRRVSILMEGPGNVRSVWWRVVDDLAADNIAAGREQAAQRMEEMQKSSSPKSALGRRRGVLAGLVNTFNSGHLYATLGMALHSVLHSQQLAAALMIVLALALYLAVWAFLRNTYQAVLRRAALEARSYERVPLDHLLYLKLVKRWGKATLTLLLESIYYTLWSLTVVGAVVKHYSYFMVPFIVAENPDVNPQEAIRLSRRMMDGHKLECFKLELSFAGWIALGFVTFGAADVLWGVPYRVAAYTEYYAQLRRQALDRGLEGSEVFNDDCLYQLADAQVLLERYGDLARAEAVIMEDIVQLPPRKRFFARNFGIWMGTLVEKKIYGRQAALRKQTQTERLEMNGEAYPRRMSPLWHRDMSTIAGHVNYLSPCTVWTLVVVFFAFGMVGWIWETMLFLVKYGMLVNRGMLHGPWLPIYGSGVVMIAVLLNRFRPKPMLEAAAIVVLCGLVEFMTSYVTEMATGLRWWDYSGYFLNLDGRICCEGLAVFALGGMAAVYLILPVIDAITMRLKPRLLVSICLVLLACFAADLLYSHFSPNTGLGVTDEPDMAQLQAWDMDGATTALAAEMAEKG